MPVLHRLAEFDFSARALVVLTWCVTLALSAWLAAQWYWRIAAPRVEAVRAPATIDPQAAAQAIASRSLFGEYVAPQAQGAASIAGGLATRFKLVGLMTRAGSTPGFVILQENGQASIAAVENEEFAPGLKVVRVFADRVEISAGGAIEVLRYEPTSAQAGVQPGDMPMQTMPPGVTAPAAMQPAQGPAPVPDMPPVEPQGPNDRPTPGESR